MKNSSNYQHRLLATIKVLVFLVSCTFIAYLISENIKEIQEIKIKNIFWFILVSICCLIIIITTLIFLSLAWFFLFGNTRKIELLQIYSKSQLLKYLPGNVFHFAYRHYECLKLGYSHKVLIKNSIKETFGLLTAAAVIAFYLLFPGTTPQWLVAHTMFAATQVWMLVVLAVGLFVVAAMWIKTIMPLLCYLFYFIGMGLSLFLLAVASEFIPPSVQFMSACYAISWITGYIIPGAPGGLGVRESTFVLISSDFMPQHQALIIITMIRILTIIGESIIYIIAKQISRIPLLWQA